MQGRPWNQDTLKAGLAALAQDVDALPGCEGISRPVLVLPSAGCAKYLALFILQEAADECMDRL